MGPHIASEGVTGWIMSNDDGGDAHYPGFRNVQLLASRFLWRRHRHAEREGAVVGKSWTTDPWAFWIYF